ncbi:hypothetical protein RchiOBHm_Chr6g0249871 [Rosa chinensis]|uniref:Pre-PUA domain-containing protein n=1 Tax=Rosa chinensis TaxID=74649 RepID=A0A2P6PKG1_ROSCH|nr:hypothetical protein RchiOBHm_Chr6g0249871 [Rosa chinensis]
MFLQSLVVPLLPILQWIKSPNNHNRRRKIHPRNIHRLRPEQIHHRVVPIRPLRQKTRSTSIPSALCSPAAHSSVSSPIPSAPLLALSDRHVARYVPKVEIKVSKYQNRVLVYGIEGGFPMFYDIDGRGKEIFPTVYALWKVPDLLPSFML